VVNIYQGSNFGSGFFRRQPRTAKYPKSSDNEEAKALEEKIAALNEVIRKARSAKQGTWLF